MLQVWSLMGGFYQKCSFMYLHKVNQLTNWTLRTFFKLNSRYKLFWSASSCVTFTLWCQSGRVDRGSDQTAAGASDQGGRDHQTVWPDGVAGFWPLPGLITSSLLLFFYNMSLLERKQLQSFTLRFSQVLGLKQNYIVHVSQIQVSKKETGQKKKKAHTH